MKKTGPYVGITGFMCLAEVVACDHAFRSATVDAKGKVPADLKFMVGVLASSKTLVGEKNRHPNSYPAVERIEGIFSLDSPHLLRTIHYNTEDPNTIEEQVREVMRVAAPGFIDAIQLNIQWANHVKMQRVRRAFPHLRIIMQVGPGALKEVNEPGDIHLGEALQAYKGVADDFLVDPSAGEGKQLDVWRAFACVSDHDIPHEMGIGMAGGRDETNVNELMGLMRRLRRPINTDSQKRMRTPADDLDTSKGSAFLRAHVAMLARCSHWFSERAAV